MIENLSLTAEPGSTVAIVGPTGAAGQILPGGLLMRFYDVDAGRILLDGNDIRTISRESLRSRIGMVLQDTWLVSGTIYDNIAYGRPGASEDEVLAAARPTSTTSCARCRSGYRTRVGDDGGTISAGEKQAHHDRRAFLARTVADPRRGHEFGGHPDRASGSAGDDPIAVSERVSSSRLAVDDPGRRSHRGDGRRPDSRAGQPRRSAGMPRGVLGDDARPSV